MITKIIQGFLNLLFGFVGFFTGPISSFVNQVFPDFGNALNEITTFFYGLVNIIAYFIYLLPRPFTMFALTSFLVVVISSQSIIILIKLSSWCIDLIKRIWVFGGK